MIQVEKSIAGVLSDAFTEFADLKAFTCLGQSLTFAELNELSDCFAAWLISHPQLERGDRIAVQLPNLLQYPVAAVGILKAGMLIVNSNPLYSASELEHQLVDSGAKALIVLSNTAYNAASIIKNTNVETVIVTKIADLHTAIKRVCMNLYSTVVKNKYKTFEFPEHESFRKALSKGRRSLTNSHVHDQLNRPCAAETTALLQYTGGTTGISKAVILSHKNLLVNMHQLVHHLGDDCPKAGSVMIAPLPLYHIYAFTANLLYAMVSGHHSVLIPDPRNVKSMIATLKKLKFSGIVGINTLYEALCANPKFTSVDFSHLQASASAGMALSPKIAERWQSITGCQILEGYGLTEASPIVSCNVSASYKQGTVGKACIETQIKIVDRQNQTLPFDSLGEILVKGPQVMGGYWQKPEETSNVLDDNGWLRTGDIGSLDEEGFLRVVDRIKDVIIISGFKVYPLEVENHVCSHPDIKEAAVIGTANGDVNEEIKLFVVSTNGELTKEDLIAYCRKSLAPYKVPRIIEFRDDLPKSNVGKILRRKLRE